MQQVMFLSQMMQNPAGGHHLGAQGGFGLTGFGQAPSQNATLQA